MKKNKNPTPEFDFADAFFKEVSEDLQNDNAKAFWKKYGVQIVAFVAVCLTIAVSFETIKHWRDVSNQKWSNAFTNAQSMQFQGKIEESLAALKSLEKNGNDIYADEAGLKIVSILLENNKTEEALEKLKVFIKNANNEKLKNIALIKLATYMVDTATPEEMMQLLSPLLDNENENAWKFEAEELVALTYLAHNQEAKALALYENILKSNNVNDSLRIRTQNMISVLTSAGDNK